ncbi:hypothetical protein [Nocardia thailandica]|uniref:hypothetical protein n=1 Tax=Nocardia thailandica TaxID=257275 RepID=UPI00031246A6|nr:hypothetical protein [Nocardia thailandica]
MTDSPDLTVTELERIREATLRTYEGGDEQYDTLPPHLRKVVDGDGGLVNMIDLAIARTKQLEALRAETQQNYAAIHAKQQRDQALIDELKKAARAVYGVGVDRTIVPPGTIARMRAENTGPSPEFREAIARARQRREETNG